MENAVNKPTLLGNDPKTDAPEQTAKPKEQTVLRWSFGLSVFLVISAIVVGLNGRYNWFPFLTPNEVGDFLAGFAGALAFIWIIAAILLQREELQLQRQELALTRAETHRLADEAQRQALALQASARTYFIQRWENALYMLNDIRLENAANQFLDALYEHALTKEAFNQAISNKFPGRDFSFRSHYTLDITRLYIVDRQYNAHLVSQTIINFGNGDEEHTVSALTKIPSEDLPPFSFAYKNNVPLLNFRSVVEEGLSLHLTGLMRDGDAAHIMRPKIANNKTYRILRDYMTALIDEMIKSAYEQAM